MWVLVLSIRTAKMAELLGVTPQTVRKYAKNGDIPHHLSPSGQLFFTDEDVANILGDNSGKDKVWAHYARSSGGDNNAIDEQFNKLNVYYGAPDFTVSDKASGLNERRQGIQKLIKLAKDGSITDIAATRKDRFTRFGYTYLEELFSSYGVALHYMTEKNTATAQEELTDDFMVLLASFTGRYSQLKSRDAKRALLNKALEEVDK